LTDSQLSDIVKESGIKEKKRVNQMKANKLTIHAQEQGYGETYAFPVYEFESGLVLVPGDGTDDWFFGCREDIQVVMITEVIGVEETSETLEWSLEALQESIKGSLAEFGSVPKLALSLL